MKKNVLLLAIVMIISISAGCINIDDSNNVSDEQPKQNEFEVGEGLALEDFNISYMGIEIGENVPFEETAEQLNVTLGVAWGDSDENTDVRMNLTIDGESYGWYTLYYPSREQADMEIDYVLNETQNTAWIVWVSIFQGKTYRDISIGDTIEKWTQAYGSADSKSYNTETTDYYVYKMSKNIEDKEIHVIVDRDSGRITNIFIDYCGQQSMRKLDTILGD